MAKNSTDNIQLFYESNKNDHFFYVADFFCYESKLVIELDGPIHDYQKEKDFNRDLILQESGLRVIHIRNEELRDLETVKKRIINL